MGNEVASARLEEWKSRVLAMSLRHIREYRPSDAPSLARIFLDAVKRTGLRCYSAAQVAAWASRAATPEEVDARCMDGRAVYVAEIDGRPEAFIDLQENGHIDMMFCAPDHTGQGLAAQLFVMLEREARRRGLARLHVDASEVAKPFFERRGFTLVRRNDLVIEGVPIHNYHMERLLC